MNIKEYFKKNYELSQIQSFGKFYYKRIAPVLAFFVRSHLLMLAKIYNSDKFPMEYVDIYAAHFKHLRKKPLNLLEIGVGGYEHKNSGGHSLRMWKQYFYNSNIFSFDIYDKKLLSKKRIKIFQGSQSDIKFLIYIANVMNTIDIIIDDGSHVNSDVITSFVTLFPYLKNGGIYCIEDTQTSYWPHAGGDSENLQNPSTMMNFFKQLTDGLNHKEFLKVNFSPTYYDKNIIAIHFYHNMIFIYKEKITVKVM